MDQLRPMMELLTTNPTAGSALFDANEAFRQDSNRPVVGYVKIATGAHTFAMDEGKALKAMLFDNHDTEPLPGLADIVQIRKDVTNQQLILGIASTAAIDQLSGTTLKLPVKDGIKPFGTGALHPMDGFYIDILDFESNRVAERYLWTILAAIGAPPLAGGYTQVSASYGAKNSRLRIHFLRDDAPPVFRANGRLIDEMIFLGKCYRLYGKGWYNHKKTIQRIDLDVAAKEKKLVSPLTTTPEASGQAARPSGEAKRQRVQPEPANPWRFVRRGAAASEPPTSRPLVSENVFDILRQHVVVTPMQICSSSGEATVLVPQILDTPDPPLQLPADAYVGGTKIHRAKAVRIEMPLDAILDEFALLDRNAKEMQQSFDKICETTKAHSKLDLPKYIVHGEADWIQFELENNPIEFGRQLHDLARTQPALLHSFVLLRTLNRWMRATWGASTPFFQLYQNVFGHKFSLEHLQQDFRNINDAADLEDITLSNGDDETLLQAHDMEAVLALGEVVFATTAPLYYTSDAAISVTTAQPTFTLPARGGQRCLASSTLTRILLSSPLSTPIQTTLKTLLQTVVTSLRPTPQEDAPNDSPMEGDQPHDAFTSWVNDLNTMTLLGELGQLEVHEHEQISFHSNERSLHVINVTEAWPSDESTHSG